jgi:3-hydroxyacyl-[acyl-carrier-protein] dehydratase
MTITILHEEIQHLIPHRFPMLLVDKVVDVVLDEKATGIKNVTINEWFFQGHFPDKPVMPGVLIIEAMAQTAGILVMKSTNQQAEGSVVYFMSIQEARFRKPVVPGDTIRIFVEKQRYRSNVWKFSGTATVDGQVVAEAVFSAMITGNNKASS